MVYILLGSTCDVMGIKDTGGPSDLLIGLTMTGQLGRWLTAVVRCGPRNPDRFLSADRSEPLEVVIDPIDDRNPIEANSPLWRHGAVAVPRRRRGILLVWAQRAAMFAEVPMHSVADLTDRHRSDPAMTAMSKPPIGPYRRAPVQVHQPDPHAPEVARRLIELIATRWPGTPAEHMGSSAVPGLAGKGIIDLLLPIEPADIPAITQALLGLGFQHQLPAVFPASRPMLWGTFRHGPTDYRVHVHVVPASSPEVTAMRGFRDALRSDPILRRRYAALKRAIVAGGPVDPVAFSKAKHDWIAATLAQLGLTNGRRRRLYKDDPSLESTRRAS